MNKKNIQILFTDDEIAVLTEAAARTGAKDMRGVIAGRGRLLLLSWAHEVFQTRGLVRGSSCSRCTGDSAMWFNSTNKRYVCDDCARCLNEIGAGGDLPVCVRGGPDSRFVHTAESEAAFARTVAAEARRQMAEPADHKSSELTAVVDKFLKEYQKLRDRPPSSSEESPNADVVGLFKSGGM